MRGGGGAVAIEEEVGGAPPVACRRSLEAWSLLPAAVGVREEVVCLLIPVCMMIRLRCV